MRIVEYRVVLPLTVNEYQVGQLWSVAEASKEQTGGGDGVEISVNEPFTLTQHKPDPPLLNGEPAYTTGQYTNKTYHMIKKLPGFIASLVSESCLNFNEEAWNAYPFCRTVLVNEYMKENFFLSITTMHVDTKINLENVHQLTPEELAIREVIYIDIADMTTVPLESPEDPKVFVSEKTGRGPLQPKWWKNTTAPVMCAYKLVKCEFKWWGLQTRVEKMLINFQLRLFCTFHRKVFCWIDKWHTLTMADIRRLEDEAKTELQQQRKHGATRGGTV